jgi:hypothetical protein
MLTSYAVSVGQDVVPITPTGPASFLITLGTYETTVLVGGSEDPQHDVYPFRHGSDYRFDLEAGEQLFGRSLPGEPDTMVYVLVRSG